MEYAYENRLTDIDPKYFYVTTTSDGCRDGTFREMLEKCVKEALAEKESEKVSILVNVDDLARLDLAANISNTKKEQKKEMKNKLPEIKKVVFNKPATIVIWADDTKTVVKAQNGETFDPEKGLAMAITKKALGNEGRYFDTIKKYVPNNDANKKKEHSKEWLAYQSLQRALFDPKATKADLKTAMSLAVGYLNEVIE